MGYRRDPDRGLLSPGGSRLEGRLIIGVDGRELQGRPTGTGRYLRNLLRFWAESTTDRLLVYFNGPTEARLPHPSIEARSLGSTAVRGLAFQEQLLPGAAREDRVEVFFSPAYTCPLRMSLPRVTAVHDLSFFSVPEDFSVLDGFRRRLLVAASVRASSAVLACSEFTAREIHGRWPEAKIDVIPLGGDDDLPKGPSRESARDALGTRGPLLLWVGSILNRRHLRELIRAVSLLRPEHPDLVLDVVGDNRTSPRLDLQRVVSDAGLQGCVRLSGFVDEGALAQRYAAADVAIFLSDYEGFGLPALEALCRGVPLLTSPAPPLGDLFGEAALTAEPTNVRAVAGALRELLGNPGLRAELREKGLRLASRFSWKETAEKTHAALSRAARP